MIGSTRRRVLIALAFLLPNLIGFLVFTAGPILFSLYMSVTDWALTRHNEFSDRQVEFVGFQNYARLLWGDEAHLFWDYLGNTAYLMLGIPIAIVGSLVLAMMLSVDATPARRRSRWNATMAAAGLTAIIAGATWLLTTPGPAPAEAALSEEFGLTDLSAHSVAEMRSAAAVLLVTVLGAVVTLGLALGKTFFRTIFYLPSLLAGVAMFLFWKTLYRPNGGLINASLDPALGVLQELVTSTPPVLWYGLGISIVGASLVWGIWLLARGATKLRYGDVGRPAFVGRILIIGMILIVGGGLGLVLVQLPVRSLLPSGYERLTSSQVIEAAEEIAGRIPSADADQLRAAATGLGDGVRVGDARQMFASMLTTSKQNREAINRAVMSRTASIHEGLASGDGLQPPDWLIDPRWAKMALVIMGVWLVVGGSNMLLYLAGLSNIPPELYEAASIDGASGWQRFIHVTWPQLAPTTFFIVVMSVIGGLQGGFEQAMTMTEGKADTITLTYYLYNVAFTDRFELGLASAIAWTLFAMTFIMTALNFKFGSQLTND